MILLKFQFDCRCFQGREASADFDGKVKQDVRRRNDGSCLATTGVCPTRACRQSGKWSEEMCKLDERWAGVADNDWAGSEHAAGGRRAIVTEIGLSTEWLLSDSQCSLSNADTVNVNHTVNSDCRPRLSLRMAFFSIIAMKISNNSHIWYKNKAQNAW